MTPATKYIRAAAGRFLATGDVDWNSGMATVTMTSPGEDDIFMQGDEADAFIAEIYALCKRYPSLDAHTAAAALAQPYAENIWN